MRFKFVEHAAHQKAGGQSNEMLAWFQRRGYDLPQPFFLYHLSVGTPDEQGDSL